jgi:hypothetical protein
MGPAPLDAKQNSVEKKGGRCSFDLPAFRSFYLLLVVPAWTTDSFTEAIVPTRASFRPTLGLLLFSSEIIPSELGVWTHIRSMSRLKCEADNPIRLVEAPPFQEWDNEEYEVFCPSSQPDIDDELERREVKL